MPLIQINILEGRSPEQKEKLIAEVSRTVADILGSPIENVRVLINELKLEHWGIAGESVKKRKERQQGGEECKR